MSVTEALTQSAISLIDTLGYAGLAVGLIVDSAGVLIPSEILIAFAAILAKQGKMDLTVVIVLSTLAQTIGAMLAYYIGKKGGIPLIHKYGKYFLISNRELAITHRLFERHGEILTFAGRCIPVVRGYIGFVGGIAEMPLKRFILASFAGAFAWTLFLVWLGYLLADNLHKIEETLRPFSILVAALLLVAIIGFVWHRISDNRKTHK